MLKRLLFCTTALFLTLADPVIADAAPLAGIVTAFSSLGALGTAVAGVAFNLAASWIMSLFTPEPKQRGVKQEMETGGDNPPAFIVGRYATAGQLGYVNVFDKPGYNIENACLVYVILLSALPVDQLSTKVIIQGETCNIDTTQTFNGFHPVTEYIKGASGGGYCLIKFHDGTQTSVDSWLYDKFHDHPDYPIDNDMWWKGCAHVIVQCWYSNKAVWTGVPEFKFIVDGIPLYDPRKDSSVGGSGSQRWNDRSTWSVAPRNPKVFAYNAIRGISYGGRKIWGGDAEAYRLPLEYWFAAMNRCDENVTKGSGDVINRFEFSGEIHFDDDPKEILVEVDKSCNGFTTEYAGTYKTWVGEPGLSVATFTDDDFIVTEEQEDTPFLPPEETYNTAYATYTEPREKWGPKDGPQFQDADALEADGREIAIDVQLPFVTEQNQVQRVLRAIVKDSRRQVTHQMQLPPIAYVLEPFDRTTIISKSRGYNGDGKDFLIGSQDDLDNSNQRILFREFNINDLSDLTEYADDISVGPIINVVPAGITLDIAVFPDQVDSASGGKDKPAIRAEWEWDGLEIGIRAILYYIRRVGTTKIIAKGSIRDPETGLAYIQHAVLRFGGAYEIQFVPEPFKAQSNAYTAWLPVTCIVVDVPAQPTLTRVSKLGTDGKLNYFVDVAWTLVAQESTYLVRVVIDGTTVPYPATTSPLRIPVSAGAVLVVDVAAVGLDGSVGDFSPTRTLTVTKKNTAPTAPTSLTATGKIGRIDYKTNKNPDSDFDHFNLYASNSNDFTTAVLVDDSRSIQLQEGNLGNAVTRYSWITAVDNSGNESSKFPVSNTGGRTATTTRVLDDDLDNSTPSTPGISVVAAGGDYDGDGTIDAGLKFTITHPNSSGTPSSPKCKEYIVQLQRATTVGGTYNDFDKGRFSVIAEDPLDALQTIEGRELNKRFFYKARVRGVSISGKKTAFSSYTTPGVQPSSYTGYTGATQAAPDVTAIANGYVVEADLGALEPSVFKEMEVRVGGVTLIKVPSLVYQDMTPRTIGATPSYTVKLYDKSGGVTNVSSATVAPAFRAATSAEVGVMAAANLGSGSVTAPAIGAGAVTTPAIISDAIIPSKVNNRDYDNRFRDPECVDLNVWSVAGSSGLAITDLQSVINKLGPWSRNVLRAMVAGASGTQGFLRTDEQIPVQTFASYKCQVIAGPISGGAANLTLRAKFYRYNASTGAIEYLSATYDQVIATASAVSSETILEGEFTASHVDASKVVIELEWTTTSGTNVYITVYNPYLGRISSRIVKDARSSVSFGATTATLAEVTLPAGFVTPDAVLLSAVVKNSSGTAKTVDFEIIRVDDGAVIYSLGNASFEAAEPFGVTWVDDDPLPFGAATYRLRLTGSTSGNTFNNGKLVAHAIYG